MRDLPQGRLQASHLTLGVRHSMNSAIHIDLRGIANALPRAETREQNLERAPRNGLMGSSTDHTENKLTDRVEMPPGTGMPKMTAQRSVQRQQTLSSIVDKQRKLHSDRSIPDQIEQNKNIIE